MDRSALMPLCAMNRHGETTAAQLFHLELMILMIAPAVARVRK
jgi:hypothetical protein